MGQAQPAGLDRHARAARDGKPVVTDGAVAVSSALGAIKIGAVTFPVGIAVLLLGAGWRRLVGLLLVVVGALCVLSLGGDVVQAFRRRGSRRS